MRVLLTDQAEKDLLKLDPEIRRRFVKKIEDMRQDRVEIASLQGEPPRWKVRVGPKWRILLYLSEDRQTVTITNCGPRRDIYRDPRHLPTPGEATGIFALL